MSTIRRQQYRFKPTLSRATLCFRELGVGKESEIGAAARRDRGVISLIHSKHDKNGRGGKRKRATKGGRHGVRFTKEELPSENKEYVCCPGENSSYSKLVLARNVVAYIEEGTTSISDVKTQAMTPDTQNQGNARHSSPLI